jgi:hypothetical protein
MRVVFRLAPLALAAALAGCGKTERSAIALEVTGDLTNGTATIGCTSSTSGTCHVLFLAGDVTSAASAAVGASTTVTGLKPGVGFCSGVTAPEPAGCKPTVLVDGRQIVRREMKVTN